MSLRERVSKNIKAQRSKAGLTQQQLADRTRLNVRYISRLESNPQNVTLDVMETLAKGLRCSIGDLVGEEKVFVNSQRSIDSLGEALQSLDDAASQIKNFIGKISLSNADK